MQSRLLRRLFLHLFYQCKFFKKRFFPIVIPMKIRQPTNHVTCAFFVSERCFTIGVDFKFQQTHLRLFKYSKVWTKNPTWSHINNLRIGTHTSANHFCQLRIKRILRSKIRKPDRHNRFVLGAGVLELRGCHAVRVDQLADNGATREECLLAQRINHVWAKRISTRVVEGGRRTCEICRWSDERRHHEQVRGRKSDKSDKTKERQYQKTERAKGLNRR